jgi:TolB-like protein
MQIWSVEIKELKTLSTSLEGRFPELEKELEQLTRTEDANVVMLYSRRCLEVIITDLCECELGRPRKTEPLKGIIEKLNREEKVPSNIIASMQSLNSLSTFGAHPKDFDPQQVRPVLLNLTTIINWYLKHKDTQSIGRKKREVEKDKPEEQKIERKDNFETARFIRKPQKRLLLLLSGMVFVVVIVVLALFVFKIIGSEKSATNLAKLEKSIAVLPFENLSTDEEQAWFSDGMTDIIINQLSKISDLRVLSRTSTLKYSKEQKTVSEIGKELGANYLIEGTVQMQEDKMRISVQLIRVLNEGHLWSDVYDREWKDIFDVQSEIAQRIAEELKTVLTPEEKERVEKTHTENPEAYNLYLQGRFFWGKRTEEGLNKSVEYFQKAINLDPDYALAYAGLADAYFIQAWWGWIPLEEGFAWAKETVLKALEIDKNLAEAHTVLGALYTYKEWRWEESRKELELAVELDPNFVTAHHYYSELLDILGQNQKARQEINTALKLDPYLPVLNALSAMYYNHAGELNNSLDQFNVVQELDPGYSPKSIRWSKIQIYLEQDEELKALEEIQKALQMDTSTAKAANYVKEVYNRSGKTGLISWLIELELQNPKPSSMQLAGYYAMLDQKEKALDWLEKALEDKYPGIVRINNNPDFDNLRSEPRFQAMIKKMGLSEYAKKE